MFHFCVRRLEPDAAMLTRLPPNPRLEKNSQGPYRPYSSSSKLVMINISGENVLMVRYFINLSLLLAASSFLTRDI